MLTLIYLGSLPSGHARSADGRESITFTRGQPVKCTAELGRALLTQDPSSWKVDDASADALQKAADAAAGRKS